MKQKLTILILVFYIDSGTVSSLFYLFNDFKQ